MYLPFLSSMTFSIWLNLMIMAIRISTRESNFQNNEHIKTPKTISYKNERFLKALLWHIQTDSYRKIYYKSSTNDTFHIFRVSYPSFHWKCFHLTGRHQCCLSNLIDIGIEYCNGWYDLFPVKIKVLINIHNFEPNRTDLRIKVM